MPPSNKRRDFLKRAAAAGALVGIAGCQGSDNEGTDEGADQGPETVIKTKTVEVTPAETPEEGTSYEKVPELDYVATTRSYSSPLYQEGILYREAMNSLGFRFNTDTLEVGSFVDRLLAREYDLANLLWSGDPGELNPLENMTKSFGTPEAKEGGANYPMFEMPAYMDKIEEARTANSLEDAQGPVNDLQRILAVNQPVVFTLHPDALAAVHKPSFGNYQAQVGSRPYFNLFTLRGLQATNQNTDTLVVGQVMGTSGYPPNPLAVTNAASQEMARLVYEQLITFSQNGEIQPRLATDWTQNDGNWELTIRDGVTAHDGEPVTAEDVVFSFNYLKNKEYTTKGQKNALLSVYDDAEVIGDNKVRVNMNTQSVMWPFNLFYAPILPKHIWSDIDDPSSAQDIPTTGTGPFKFDSFEAENQATFSLYEDHYWGDQFNFDSLIYQIYSTNTTLINDVNQGNVTIAQRLTPQSFKRGNSLQNIKTQSNPNLGTHGLFLRTDREPFNDVLVRQAVAHAIDDQRVNQAVFSGRARRATNVVSPAAEFWYNDDLTPFENSLSKARQKLVESGFRYDDDGQLLKPVDWEPSARYINPLD
jgi:peptide/nickel transport system substrate-binding protein